MEGSGHAKRNPLLPFSNAKRLEMGMAGCLRRVGSVIRIEFQCKAEPVFRSAFSPCSSEQKHIVTVMSESGATTT